MKVAVIGAGPAGMSCANALLSFGLEPVVIERADHVGGIQRANFHPNLWMLGMPGETGSGITERLASHYFDLAIVTHLQADILAVAGRDTGFRLRLAQAGVERLLDVAALVLATGSQPRSTPALAAMARQSDRVIIGPLSKTIQDGIQGSRVLILGGGDNALDHALYLAERGNRVTVCARGEYSARRQFQAACAGRTEIELRKGCQPDALVAREDVISATWDAREETYDWLLVMYGYQPNTAILERFEPAIRPRLADSGYIHVERDQRTSAPGIYAAGDVTDNIQPSVPTAIAQGLAAAKAVELSLP
ncbi:MAG: NAD(P)/FAD-dependent oxidoreductase [Gallionellaceae bacterium]|nr:NAD(P)/FAD-dependent oxidoreductase [Gallionellaceae bacterium]